MITQYTILSDTKKTMVKWTALVSVTLLDGKKEIHLLFDHDTLCKVSYTDLTVAEGDIAGLNAILGAQDLSVLLTELEAFRLAEQQKALPEPQAQLTATTEQGETKPEGSAIAGRINCEPKGDDDDSGAVA